MTDQTTMPYRVRSFDAAFDPFGSDAYLGSYAEAVACAQDRALLPGHEHVYVMCGHGRYDHCQHGCHDTAGSIPAPNTPAPKVTP